MVNNKNIIWIIGIFLLLLFINNSGKKEVFNSNSGNKYLDSCYNDGGFFFLLDGVQMDNPTLWTKNIGTKYYDEVLVGNIADLPFCLNTESLKKATKQNDNHGAFTECISPCPNNFECVNFNTPAYGNSNQCIIKYELTTNTNEIPLINSAMTRYLEIYSSYYPTVIKELYIERCSELGGTWDEGKQSRKLSEGVNGYCYCSNGEFMDYETGCTSTSYSHSSNCNFWEKLENGQCTTNNTFLIIAGIVGFIFLLLIMKK